MLKEHWKKAILKSKPLLTLYSTQAPLDAFEMLDFLKILWKWNFYSWRANVPFSIIFLKLL